MAFVTSSFTPATSATSSFTGDRVCAAASPTAAAPASGPVVARLGTVLGNSSLDKLGLSKYAERFSVKEAAPPTGKSADYEEIISGCYRQLFGNAYVMESERAELAKYESEFRDGQYTVKEFCRMVVKSYQYRKRFFDSRPLYGAIELAFKHILGRTPDGLEQYREKSGIYDTKGYDAMIDSFFDNGEYDAFYDADTVPFIRGHLTTSNLSMASFTHLFQMVRGSSTSDKSNLKTLTNQINLNMSGIQSIPLPVIPPGQDGEAYQTLDAMPGSWNSGVSGGSMARTSHGTRQESGKMFRIEVSNFSQAKSTNGGSGIVLRSRNGKFYKGANNGAGTKISDFRRANRVYLVPFDELSATYVKIHNSGGSIASITPV